jgi:hypothetical protein
LDLGLLNDQDLHVAFASKDVDANILVMADDQQIDAPPGDLQIVDPEFFQRVGKRRACEAELGFRAVDLQSEGRLQQQEDRGRRPGLGRARHRIKDRSGPRIFHETAK